MMLLMFSLNHLSLDLIRFSFCRMWEFCRRGTWWRTMNRAGLNIFNDHFVFFDSFCTWILLCNCQASAWQLRLAMLLSHELAHAVDNPELLRQHVRQSRRAAEPEVHDHGYESLSILTTAYSSRCPEKPITSNFMFSYVFQIWMSIWGWSLCGSLGIFCRIQLAFFPWLRVMEIQCSWHSKKGLTPRICQLRLARGKVRILHCVNTLGTRLNTFPDSHGISECVLPWVGRPVSIPLVSIPVRLLSVLDPTGMLEFLLEIAAGAIARP